MAILKEPGPQTVVVVAVVGDTTLLFAFVGGRANPSVQFGGAPSTVAGLVELLGTLADLLGGWPRSGNGASLCIFSTSASNWFCIKAIAVSKS